MFCYLFYTPTQQHSYGTYTDALYIALDSAIATMMKRVKDKEGDNVPSVEDVSDDDEEEDEEMEEFEEMDEMDEEHDEDEDDEESEEDIPQVKRRKQ